MLSQPLVLEHCNLEALTLEPVQGCRYWLFHVRCLPGVEVCMDGPAHPLQHQQVHSPAGHLFTQGVVHPGGRGGDWSHNAVEWSLALLPGQVKAGAALATVPGHQPPLVQTCPDCGAHSGHLQIGCILGIKSTETKGGVWSLFRYHIKALYKGLPKSKIVTIEYYFDIRMQARFLLNKFNVSVARFCKARGHR